MDFFVWRAFCGPLVVSCCTVATLHTTPHPLRITQQLGVIFLRGVGLWWPAGHTSFLPWTCVLSDLVCGDVLPKHFPGHTQTQAHIGLWKKVSPKIRTRRHTYPRTHTKAHTQMQTRTHTYVCTRTRTHTRLHIGTRKHPHRHINTNTITNINAGTDRGTDTGAGTDTHTHTHTHTSERNNRHIGT